MVLKYLKRLAFKGLRWALFKPLMLSIFLIAWLGGEEPKVLYLAYLQDPAHSMTVQWHTGKGVDSVIYYQKAGTERWQLVRGSVEEVKDFDVWVHAVELLGLEADSEYVFRLSKEGKDYRFQTLPEKLTRPVKIAIGGDAYYGKGELFRKMNRQIASQDPDFVVVGGDIAYAIKRLRLSKRCKSELKRWQQFFQIWKEDMVASDGRLIPLVAVVGNHDVPSGQVNPAKRPVMFYEMFKFPEKGISYRALDIGSYLSLILLDSDHTYQVEGKQTDWLKAALRQRRHRPYKIVAYHVGAYPAFYPYNGSISVKIRKNWVPLFEEYNVPIVFEHHNHCYKRTFRLKNDKVDETGIWYLGDGSWGVPPRVTHTGWYLEKAEKINAYYLVVLDKEKMVITPKTIEGKEIEVPINILTYGPSPVGPVRL